MAIKVARQTEPLAQACGQGKRRWRKPADKFSRRVTGLAPGALIAIRRRFCPGGARTGQVFVFARPMWYITPLDGEPVDPIRRACDCLVSGLQFSSFQQP